MAVFPSLAPTSRSLSLGDFPQGFYEGVSGDIVRFKTSNDRVGQKLSLSFEHITESQAQEIIDHYRGQQGTLISFTLPDESWQGYSTRPIPAADYEWRYAKSFTVDASPAPSRYSITVELESVAI